MSALQRGDHAGSADPFVNGQAQLTQSLGHQGRRAVLLVGELRVGMNIPAQCHEVWHQVVDFQGLVGHFLSLPGVPTCGAARFCEGTH